MEYFDRTENIYQSGSPIHHNHIESIVKITVSPNTPSPEPQEHEQSDQNYSVITTTVESIRESTAELTNVGGMGKSNCFHKLEEQGGHSSTNNILHHSNDQQPSLGSEYASSSRDPRDLPVCFDFGIQDYLCRRVEETEFDLSSDTDTSYLGASPPFGDICQSSIEAMPILLDTQLNPQSDEQLSRAHMEQLASRLSLNLKESNTSKFAKSISKESLLSFHATPPPNYNNDNKTKVYQERRFPRPFRRNISLPAAIFKSYIQQNTEFTNLREKHDKGGMTRAETLTGTNSSSTHHRLSRIESISNSSQINLTDEPHDRSLTSSANSVSSNWNLSGSIDSDVENEPFTSEIEKRSLIIRHLRSLVRQNTTGNFAPPDYHI